MSLQSNLKLFLVEYNLVPPSLLRRRQEEELRAWEKARKGYFPHRLKQKIVLDNAAAFGTRILVETGTYYGLMLQGCLPHFDQLYSIEVEPHFYRRACRVFSGHPKVKLLRGDSAEVLPPLLRTISVPCLFWLDAHYSGGLTGQARIETPIRTELEAIFHHPCRHVVLIDDADCFDGTHDYPEVEWIAETAKTNGYAFAKGQNVIRLRPAPL